MGFTTRITVHKHFRPAIFIPVSISTKADVPDRLADYHTSATNVEDLAIWQYNVECNHLQPQLFQLPLLTPVKIDKLEQLLTGHPNKQLVNEVLHRFKYGFSLKYNGLRTGLIHKNLASAFQYPKLLQQHLDKEILLGTVLGPFKEPPLPELICLPVGMVPKMNSKKWP